MPSRIAQLKKRAQTCSSSTLRLMLKSCTYTTHIQQAQSSQWSCNRSYVLQD